MFTFLAQLIVALQIVTRPSVRAHIEGGQKKTYHFLRKKKMRILVKGHCTEQDTQSYCSIKLATSRELQKIPRTEHVFVHLEKIMEHSNVPHETLSYRSISTDDLRSGDLLTQWKYEGSDSYGSIRGHLTS